MENQTERGPERILTKEEVMEVIGRYAENAEVTEEILDEEGLLFRLTAKSEGKNPGESNEYEYMRKGRIPNGGGGTTKTSIEVVYYVDGKPVSGETVANYDNETGKWEEVK